MWKPEYTLRSARSGFCMPIYCPTSTETAMPKPNIGMNASVLMLNAILVAARLVVPRRPTRRMKIVNPAISTKNCTPLGKPKRRSRAKSSLSKRQPASVR